MHTNIHTYRTYMYACSSSASFLQGDFGFGGNALRRHPDWADINCETLKQKLTSRCHNIGLRPGTIWQHEQVGHEPLPAAPHPTTPHTQPLRPPAACRRLCGLWRRAPCYGEVLGKSRGRLNTRSCVWYTPVFFFPVFFLSLSLSSRWCLMSHPQQHLPLLISQGASDSSDLKRSTGRAKWLVMRRMSEVGIPMLEKRPRNSTASEMKAAAQRIPEGSWSVITWHQ